MGLTPRQIQHNAFLIRISKDPLKVNLRRSVAVGMLFVWESVTFTEKNNYSSAEVRALNDSLSEVVGVQPFQQIEGMHLLKTCVYVC